MNAERLTFDCAFLNDTQMAELTQEQSALATALSRVNGQSRANGLSSTDWLPFRFMPPFCPIAGGSGRIRVGKPVAIDGWIARPVSFDIAEGRYDPPILPGYPPLPAIPCVILGYAGTDQARAESTLAGLTTTGHNAEELTATAWYSARLTLDISWEEGRFYTVTREIGKPHWQQRP
ncbi:MAG TPA: hypothetical protein PKO22_07115 [Treponemataceae bacterium]|nr:hypothetical protein [Treponemataceae bacterium]